MAVNVSVDNLSAAIIEELNKYTDEVQIKVADAVLEVGKTTAKDLKKTTQVGKSNVWVQYPKGWTVQNVHRKGKQIAEVHNKTDYRLTHLLENGHVIKNGTGRTYGRTREFPHISVENEKAQQLLEKKVMEAIKG